MPLLLPISILALWQLAAQRCWIEPALLPSPAIVARALIDLQRSGALADDLRITGGRLLAGFGLGTVTGLIVGALVGESSIARRMLDPTLQALRAVPSIAWVPLFILWFGIFEAPKILLIAVGVFFPVYLNFSAGLAGCDRKLIEVGRVGEFSRWELLWRIRLPASLPALATGIRGGLGLGWMFVAAAELIGASRGLGFELMDGEQTGRPERVIAALIVFALCGKATDLVAAMFIRRVLAWQDTEDGMDAKASPG